MTEPITDEEMAELNDLADKLLENSHPTVVRFLIRSVPCLIAEVRRLREEARPKKFVLVWLDGKKNEIEGRDIQDALNKSGWGGGALRALDFWQEIKDDH